MPRNVGSIPPEWFDAENIVFWFFLRMTWPSPVDTLRWTTRPEDLFNGDIFNGEAEQDWDGTKNWTPGQFEQGEQTAVAISDITFGNTDYYFTNIMNQFAYGVRGIPMTVWAAAYTAAMTAVPAGSPPAHQFLDRVVLYDGVANRAEVGKQSVRVSLQSFSSPLTAKYPVRRFSPAFDFLTIPKDNLKIPFGSAGTVVLPTRQGPTDTSGSGGGTDVPPPGGFAGPTARMPVVRIPPGNRPRPRSPGGPTRGGTRTVDR